MKNTTDIAPEPFEIRQRVIELRERFGECDWLRVVGGVTAEAYRLAGLTAEEFGALLRAEMVKRGRLLIHFRRKDIMRLRAGFDGADGAITDQDGFAHLHLHFPGGHYSDAGSEPTLEFNGTLRSSLAVVGGLRRPISALGMAKAPRCLLAGGGRMMGSLDTKRHRWGSTTTTVWPTFRLETLAIMPDAVAKQLGVQRQRSLSHIPWLDAYEAPAAFEPPQRSVELATPSMVRKRPTLRLVGS